MNTKHVLMAAGLLVTAWLAFFADKTPNTGVTEAVNRTTTSETKSATREVAPIPVTGSTIKSPSSAVTTSGRSGKEKKEISILELRPRDQLLGSTSFEKGTDGVFAAQSWVPPPPPVQKPPPPPPPTAPALPFSYLGKKNEDGKLEIYIGRGDQTYIAREQMVIDDTYRIDAIKPPLMTFTYLPLKQVQTLTIGGVD
ncbi:hypothetical protein [Undibacterium terreum]|nr:hypothetical protein [Undibacterium terreum]